MHSFTPMAEPDMHTAGDMRWAAQVDAIVGHGYALKKLPVELAPDLLLGSYAEAQDPEGLAALGVTHVLNMASGVGMETGASFYGDHCAYKAIDADDDASYDLIGQHFGECYAFLKLARAERGRLFIHCMAGINRSGAMSIAFLVADGMDLLSAARHAHELRGPICWNKVRRAVVERDALGRAKQLLALR
jgi:hypothetical protein